MKLTAHKIGEGRKTVVVLVDENGVEHGRCGGLRAERANYALIGRKWHTVGETAVEPTEVAANQKVERITEWVSAGRVALKAGTTRAEYNALCDRLKAEGHADASIISGRFDHYAVGSPLVTEGEVAYGSPVVVAYRIREYAPWLVGLRQSKVSPNAKGRVGYEVVDDVVQIS